ncbi:hypothetical protein PVK06_012562 [Gossypium arboreum]|uniref:Uncharacterized protein n=1 Tax=Gossypium arboreum TaxID=29729 RepID=A0ABR0QC40_GOSAR|nr:hypothetical protein PVK06_012562 [Gossypium arboreum]
MSDMVAETVNILREILEALAPLEEVVHDVLNSDHDDRCIFENLLDLDDGNQQEFGIDNCDDELKITQVILDPINV